MPIRVQLYLVCFGFIDCVVFSEYYVYFSEMMIPKIGLICFFFRFINRNYALI